jgi:hypothetical protein
MADGSGSGNVTWGRNSFRRAGVLNLGATVAQ